MSSPSLPSRVAALPCLLTSFVLTLVFQGSIVDPRHTIDSPDRRIKSIIDEAEIVCGSYIVPGGIWDVSLISEFPVR